MPVDAQTWRVRTGMHNASRQPAIRTTPNTIESVKELNVQTCCDAFLEGLATVLLLLCNLLRGRVGVFDLTPARCGGPKRAVAPMEIVNATFAGIVLLFCLALALSLLILQAGDVERNPGPDVLQLEDLPVLMRNIIDVAGQWHMLGVQLNFNPEILNRFPPAVQADPVRALQELLTRWLERATPPPTLQALAEAIGGPVIGNELLADRLLAQREDFPAVQAAGIAVNIDTVRAKIEHLKSEFRALKTAARDELIVGGIGVRDLVDTLTSIPAARRLGQEHMRVFLQNSIRAFYQSDNITELFGLLNLYWTYLEIRLLEYIINCPEYESVLNTIRPRMIAYKDQLQQFKEETPLSLFCELQGDDYLPHERPRPLPGFEIMAIHFNRQLQMMTLKNVEEFRVQFAGEYSLTDCAMMLQAIIAGSVIVIWLVPLSAVAYIEKMIHSTEELDFFQEHRIVKILLNNHCIYQDQSHLALEEDKIKPTIYQPPGVASTSQAMMATSSEVQLPESHSTSSALRDGQSAVVKQSADRRYDFMDEPSKDFYCPVTDELLLEPQLTACCGYHLSMAAATRLKEEGKPCPLCRNSNLVTVLSQFLQRSVRELQVFCTHKDRGCGWEGQLGNLDSHLNSCEKKNTPLLPIKEITLHWEQKKPAPEKTTRGSFTVNDDTAYFTPWNSDKVYNYRLDGDQWDELPPCPHTEPGLAVIKGLLTAVGGKEGSEFTGNLFSWSDGTWRKIFPPMRAKRSRPAVVSTPDDKYITVAGGWVRGWTTDVELFDTQSSQWCYVSSLPKPLVGTDATISGSAIYVQDTGHSVFSCSIESLVSSSQQGRDDQSGSSEQVWKAIRDIPVESSTLVTLCNQLVAVGGCTEKPTADIYQYTSRRRWKKIGEMLMPRYDCLVAVLPEDKMVVVDGWIHVGVSTDAVEVATVLEL